MKNRYSNLKILHFQDRLKNLKTGLPVSPVHVRIKPMNACNHNCWYCAYRFDNLKLGENINYKDQIPFSKFMEIIDDLGEMGVKAVTLSGGGEPLLYPRLEEILKALNEKNIKIGILTNGSNLKNELAHDIAKYVSWVRISMDGYDNESHQLSRKTALNDFDNIIQNIKSFKKIKTDSILGVSYIVNKNNSHSILDFVTNMKQLGVDHVKISACVVGNSSRENNLYHQDIQEIVREQIEKAILLQNKDFKIIDHYHRMPDLFLKEYKRCSFIHFMTIIGADSKVYSCQDKAYTDEGLLGDISGDRFKDFWFSSDNQKRLNAINPSVDCQHHCVSHSKNIALNEYLSVDDDHLEFI